MFHVRLVLTIFTNQTGGQVIEPLLENHRAYPILRSILICNAACCHPLIVILLVATQFTILVFLSDLGFILHFFS